jgi:hypothetical protein
VRRCVCRGVVRNGDVMSDHFVTMEGFDVMDQAVGDAQREVSFDGGATYRSLSAGERTDGVKVAVGQKFVARVSKEGLFPVVQPLVVPSPADLDSDGERDYGALPFFSHSMNHSASAGWNHVFGASLTLLRDGQPDRKAHGCDDIPSYSWDTLSFSGAQVFNASGAGWGRFVGTVAPHVPSLGAGKLLFLKSVRNAKLDDNSARVPALTAVFVPSCVDLGKPIPMHVFFSPNTGVKKGEYPYGLEFNAMVDNYLVSGEKRFIQQLNVSKKKCVLVFPIAPREAQFAGILPALRLRRFLHEVAYCLLRLVGGRAFSFVRPALGTCSASTFSSGAYSLTPLILSSMGSEFPELREIYVLDGFRGESAGGYAELAGALSGWWRGGRNGRRVRMYTKYDELLAPGATPSFARNITVRSGAAFACEGPDSTFAYVPIPFWRTLFNEQVDSGHPLSAYFGKWNKNPAMRDDDALVHQLIPCIFLGHALKNSSYEDA